MVGVFTHLVCSVKGATPSQCRRDIGPDTAAMRHGCRLHPQRAILVRGVGTGKLIDSLNLNDAYALLKWPPFDLLEMDNRLLKLSTKMLIKGGTVADLATKVGCEPSIVCGFINACYRAGYIINRSDLNPDRLTDVSGEGVLGMIKDAFR